MTEDNDMNEQSLQSILNNINEKCIKNEQEIHYE
jgi:hypothetical protein